MSHTSSASCIPAYQAHTLRKRNMRICVAQTCTYMRTCMHMHAHIRDIPYTDLEMSTGVMNIAIASPASRASHLNDAGW